MVENRINQTTKIELNRKEGLEFAQWGIMTLYVGTDCSYDDLRQAINPKVKQNVFWLEKPNKNQRISPVFGLAEKAEKI